MDITKQSTGMWRTRWATIGAAVAVTLGAGGLFAANATATSSSFVPVSPTACSTPASAPDSTARWCRTRHDCSTSPGRSRS